jgi:hypothetical protein
MPQRAKRLVSLASTLILLFGSFVVFAGNETAVADSDRAALRAQLTALEASNEIVLMFIPKSIAFVFEIKAEDLPKVACTYEIRPATRSTLGEVLKILDDNIITYREGREEIGEVRIGMAFKDRGQLLQDFYFERFGWFYDVRGISGKYRIFALARLEKQLRALLTRKDVILVNSNYMTSCPHS